MAPPETLAEFIESMIPYALRAGVNLHDFYAMTPAEVILYIKSYADGEERRIKRDAANAYNTAVLVNKAFSGKLKKLYDEFESLFGKEAEEAALNQFKAQMMDFAAGHNSQRGGGDG
ncbi:MAG: hypothetical protein Q4G33_09980 [bacterium]|nr:hypothetical protein [bacterium]